MFPPLPELPMTASLDDARRLLQTASLEADELSAKIDAAELALAKVIQESQSTINRMRLERSELERKIYWSKGYLSPIRRLPAEILREIFICCWEDHPCCAWVLAAVCTSWRRIALRAPILWSKIRIVTTQHTSADTIRLWLERSGDKIPLDIEIFLRVTGSDDLRGRSRLDISPPSSPVPWGFAPPPPSSAIVSHYMLPPSPIPLPSMASPLSPLALAPSSAPHDSWSHSSTSDPRRCSVSASRSVNSWGHIAIYYLVEQMHRWKRFIFRFDRQFTSVTALKSIAGDAPLLEEFEISCAEMGYYPGPEWQWLPNASPTDTPSLPKLRALTLQHAPFKWSSPIFRTNLHTLNLRSLPGTSLPLDRVMHIITNNPALEDVTLNLAATSSPVLPLAATTLTNVRRFHIGGHPTLGSLLDFLILPKLEDFGIDIDVREQDTVISSLLTRSGKPPLEHLNIAYADDNHVKSVRHIYYGSTVTISWQALLNDLSHLKSLCVGSMLLEPLMTALDLPDEDSQSDTWLCPKLEYLAMRDCRCPGVEGDGVGRIIQMVEARNPGAGSGSATSVGGVTPVKLKSLELHNCASLGQDIVEWLKRRLDELVWNDNEYER